MRRAPCTATLVLVLLAGIARADDAVVIVPEIEVRSGPSATFYATGKLRQGEKVEIVRTEEGGWLAIKPPRNSFSWIKMSLIDRAGHAAVVLGPDVPVRIGSDLFKGEPTVQQVKLQRGTQVLILDTKQVYANDGGWLAIVPPPQEVRFIPADAVRQTQAVQTTSQASPAPVAGAGTSDHELWELARQLESVGNAAEAEKTYQKLAHQTTDHSLSMRCYNQIHHMRQTARAGATATTPWNRQQAPAQSVSQMQTPRQTLSLPFPAQQQRPPARPVLQNSGPGRLRRAAFNIDNKPGYVLENAQGLPVMYVTAQPGLNLEPYVNLVVDLHGPVIFRGDVRKNYMTATNVTPLQ